MPSLVMVIVLILLIIDRANSLQKFAFIYTDIDQLIMWNGALDYSNGIFHEPFFYGQSYNYMLESLVSVPFLWFNIPVYKALPIATCLISLLPYLVLSFILFRKKQSTWACFALAIPLILPLEYNLLTAISRGFVQGLFFIPLLFIPLFHPSKRNSLKLLFIASALCFIANQSSILIIFPVVIYVISFHKKNRFFFMNMLWTLPLLIFDFACKFHYKLHPEKVLHTISGVRLDPSTLFKSLTKFDHFEFLFPFLLKAGILYIFLLLILTFYVYKKGLKKELIFLYSVLFILLISFAIPKVQGSYPLENAGLFFSISRFYLCLPLLVFLSFYLVFVHSKFKNYLLYFLLGIVITSFYVKNLNTEEKISQIIENTSFPVAKNQDVLDRTKMILDICKDKQIELLVHKKSPGWDWKNEMDSYAIDAIIHSRPDLNQALISVNVSGDRRSWLYDQSQSCEGILLIGFYEDGLNLDDFDYEILNEKYIWIKNHQTSPPILFKKLNIQFGNFSS